ncbi:hypothetical protein Pfo_005428 [Paulownia fortunei]|nr:hypothetical protein Pfo_005428 [Paulownia fortunei]
MAARGCYFFLFPTLYLISFSIAIGFNNITTDQSTLVVFKSHITSDTYNVLAENWSTTTSVCEWIGVTCGSRNHRVTGLNISNMGLTGTIPAHLGNLSFLVYLDMSSNNFHGNLPDELSRLHRLRVINLNSNSFNALIPPWLGFLPQLRVLSLQENNFTGFIPSSLSNISKLEFLELSSNLLQGKIPEEIGNLSNLKGFVAADNKLTGPIPLPIFNISSLETISFSTNKLYGNLGTNICRNPSNLRTLYLSSNELSGPLPFSLSHCSQLQALSLAYNKFNGAIPSGIANLRMLEILNLGHNNLGGPIPEEIGNLCELKRLSIGNNNISGSIPLTMFNISSLQYMDLGNNSLFGILPLTNIFIFFFPCIFILLAGLIPQQITSLYKLEVLRLDYNSLSGSIPVGIFNISSLQSIVLACNNLSGTLPSTMGHKLPNLEILYLHRNSLTGQIPESISNSSKLTILSLNSNKFSGPIPDSLGNLRFLSCLHLFGNSLTSDSSKELSFITSLISCQYLRDVNIADNPLHGVLPASIGNLSTSLEKIYASSCRIKGNIPNEIGNLSHLMTLDLTDNELSGFIPKTFQGLQSLQGLSLGNNKISGSFPSSLCYLHKLSSLNLSQNEISGPILDCMGNLTSLREIDLASNKLTSSIPFSLWNLNDLLSLPQEVENLKVAIYIDLSRNRFTGVIPNISGGMQYLIKFSLASNNFQGSIPQSFGKMISLEWLDLSNNNLSGEIPKVLERLQFLKYFNVSFNKLRGEIPSGGPFKYFTYLFFVSNEALCGAPQLHVPPCRNTSSHKLRTRRIVLVISVIITSLILTMILVFSWIMRHKRKEVPFQADLFHNTTAGRFSYKQIQQATDAFSQGNLLGTGSFGAVYRATFEKGMVFAVKVFNLPLEDASKSFKTECEMLSNLRHRNLTKVISACCNLDFKALVLEYMQNGSLEGWLYSDVHFLDIMQRLDIMIDVASALEYLHHGYPTPVIHCDLKPSNILLDNDMVGHVSDFGITKLLGEEESKVHTKTLATLGYIAPEYGTEGIVSRASDVYSYGILLMETFTRRRPSDNMFAGDLSLRSWINATLPNGLRQVVDSNLMRAEETHFTEKLQCVSWIIDLALNCTVQSPRDRMNMKDVLTTLKKIKLHFIAILQ